jgi:hypothetical protein
LGAPEPDKAWLLAGIGRDPSSGFE